MSKFAIQIVKESGVDVDKLLELLISGATSEISTYYHYDLLCRNLSDSEGEDLYALVEIAKLEDKNHYEALMTRIYELGGELPKELTECGYLTEGDLVDGVVNPIDILKILRQTEACAMEGYNEICKMTYSKDFRTYDLALAILHEKTEHESWFAGFLDGEPTEQYIRQGVTSPFVRKFLNNGDIVE